MLSRVWSDLPRKFEAMAYYARNRAVFRGCFPWSIDCARDFLELHRLDWMYEQSAASVKPDEDTLMNMPINAQKDSSR